MVRKMLADGKHLTVSAGLVGVSAPLLMKQLVKVLLGQSVSHKKSSSE